LQALQTAAFEFHLTPKELALVIKNTYNNETNSIKYADVKNFVTQVDQNKQLQQNPSKTLSTKSDGIEQTMP
jgi:hypothetical protein